MWCFAFLLKKIKQSKSRYTCKWRAARGARPRKIHVRKLFFFELFFNFFYANHDTEKDKNEKNARWTRKDTCAKWTKFLLFFDNKIGANSTENSRSPRAFFGCAHCTSMLKVRFFLKTILTYTLETSTWAVQALPKWQPKTSTPPW